MKSTQPITKKQVKKLVIITSIVFAVAGILIYAHVTQLVIPVEKPPLRLALHQWPGYDIAFIAKDKGFFAKNNVNVQLTYYTHYDEGTDLYTKHETDGMFLTYADALTFSSVALPTKIVYVVDYSNNGDVIVGKVNSIQDLKGKTVSVDGINTFSHLFVIKVLEKFGVNPNDVNFEYVPAQNVAAALDAGNITAGHTWEPTKSLALSKGYKILAREADVPGMITDVLIFSEQTVKERPDDVKAVIKSLAEARDFVYSNRNESLAIVQKENGVDPQDENSGFNDMILLDLKQNVDAMKPSNDTHSLFDSGKIISDFFFNNGRINTKPNLDDIIDPTFVNNLASENNQK